MSIMQLVVDNYLWKYESESENENKSEYAADFEKLKTKEYIKADEAYHKFLESIHDKTLNNNHDKLLDIHETIVPDYILEREKINFILGFQYASKVFKELYLMGGVDGE